MLLKYFRIKYTATNSLKLIMWLIVFFFVSDEHGWTSNVIWLSPTWLLIFRLDVANKKPLFTKPASTWTEISCSKDKIFYSYKILYPTPGCYTGEMLFANGSKIIRNWFLTLQLDICKIIGDVPKWAQERAWM